MAANPQISLLGSHFHPGSTLNILRLSFSTTTIAESFPFRRSLKTPWSMSALILRLFQIAQNVLSLQSLPPGSLYPSGYSLAQAIRC
jgi:hypothetical protein